MARRWGLVVAALVVLAPAGCGFADDAYENAQKQLDRSSPDLTVKASTTTAAPFDTVPGLPARRVPVRRATPEEVAAGGVNATGPAPAGSPPGPGSPATPGAPVRGGGPGASRPVPATTTTTQPPTPLCRAARSVQETGGLLVLSADAAPDAYRTAVGSAAASFRRMVALLPADRRAVGDTVGAAFAEVEAQMAVAVTSAEMRASVQSFMQAQGPSITKVLQLASFFCPQVIDGGTDQAETIVIDQ